MKLDNSSIQNIEEEIVGEFELFDEWADKYQYIIELGQKLPPLNEKYKIEENKIKGCQSSVWLNSYIKNDRVYFEADSDSMFVKGEIALLIRALSGQKAEDIINADLAFIDKIGLRQHIAVTRANGLANMIKQMKLFAVGYQPTQPSQREGFKSTKMISEEINKTTSESSAEQRSPLEGDLAEPIKSLEERVKDVLKTCYDPEIPVNIYELGLIYEVKVNEGNDVHVKMSLTSPACPVAETLPLEVEQKIKAIPDVNSAKVEITFEPPWNKDMMSEEAKLELRNVVTYE